MKATSFALTFLLSFSIQAYAQNLSPDELNRRAIERRAVSAIIWGMPAVNFAATAAGGVGGNPDKDASYLSVTPARNDGTTVHKLTVKDVPVDAFWSISVYNAKGYFEKNDLDAYSLNNVTATKKADGSVDVQFGNCGGKIPNCIPIPKGWNYTVRLYRPRKEILDGSWKFPEAQPVN